MRKIDTADAPLSRVTGLHDVVLEPQPTEWFIIRERWTAPEPAEWHALSEPEKDAHFQQHYHHDYFPVRAWAFIACSAEDWRGAWDIVPLIEDATRNCLVVAETTSGYLDVHCPPFEMHCFDLMEAQGLNQLPDLDTATGQSARRIRRDFIRELRLADLKARLGFTPRVTFIDQEGRRYEP